MQTKITLSNQSQELEIIPLEGFEIDLENSDLKNGKVLFKEVKSKYPSDFDSDYKRDGLLSSLAVSEKYADKLNTLDSLLCLRDEYNRIDGFTEGFRFGKINYCIYNNHTGKLTLSSWKNVNKIMCFGKKETAEI